MFPASRLSPAQMHIDPMEPGIDMGIHIKV
jgi:hypothetical protein